MKGYENLIGQTFGRWTVVGDPVIGDPGQRKWLCRCACGTERYVLERSLRYGGSRSCGCLRREEASKAVAHDLTGQQFGELTVLERLPSDARGAVLWRCACSCGRTCVYPATLLVTGKRTHCGCRTVKKYAFADIAGQVFGRLTALEPTDRRDSRGFVFWRCRCSCGNTVEVSYNNLMYGNQQSCGCQKKEHDRKLGSFLNHMDGTSLEMLRSKKLLTDNTTGYKGVYRINGKYVAKIVFQKKQYYLGTYEQIEDAARARREAEEAVFSTALPFYEAWKKKADADPDWAAANPVRVTVKRDSTDRLFLEMLPDLA